MPFATAKVLVHATLISCFLTPADVPQEQAPHWHTDYTHAQQEAKKLNKLMFVVFR